MSRIDEALKKAREQAEADKLGAHRADAGHARSTASAPLPSAELFDAPWTFEAGVPDSGAAGEAAAFGKRGDDAAALAPRFAPARVGAVEAPVAATAPGPQERSTPAADAPPALDETIAPAGILIAPADSAPTAAPPTGPMAVFKGFDERLAQRLVVNPRAKSATVEQYRKLAGALHHAQLDRGVRTVMISSALPGEGKTLTATNLALTLSESFRRKVLLIDADLRRPSLHEVFQVSNLSGLNDGLKAGADERLSVVRVSATLSLLTAGRPDPDPMSGLSSPRIRRIVEEAAARFDWVVIDTPPVGLLPDAHLLATMVDCALLVIQAASTPHEMVRRAVEALGRDRILGVVLNRAEEGVRFGRYDRYYNYERPEVVAGR